MGKEKKKRGKEIRKSLACGQTGSKAGNRQARVASNLNVDWSTNQNGLPVAGLLGVCLHPEAGGSNANHGRPYDHSLRMTARGVGQGYAPSR